MPHRPCLVALAIGLTASALSAASPASAQERLHLDTFGDEALHRLTLPEQGDPLFARVEGALGVEADIARGAAPSPAWPFALTQDLGLGLRHGRTDALQLRIDSVLPLPIAPLGKAGHLTDEDLEFAHRLHAQLGLGGLDDDGKLRKGRGGADVSVDGDINASGKYSTSFVRRDVGPFPFVEGMGRVTIAPRLNLDDETGLVLPISAEVRGVDVERPADEIGSVSKRFSSGIGLKFYTPEVSNGLIEAAGVGWETVSFTPRAHAAAPKLGGVERFDLRLLHVDAMTFSGDKAFEGEVSTNVGANWLQDPTGKASLATFASSFSMALHGSPDSDLTRSQIGAGFGFVYDGTYFADGSALSRRARFEGYIEGFALERRAGASARVIAERMIDLSAASNPYRGAVAAEWFLAPIEPLQLGMDFTSTQMCVSSATAADPAWCHRFGVFLRGAFHAAKTRPERKPPTPEPPPPPPPPPPEPRVQQVAE